MPDKHFCGADDLGLAITEYASLVKSQEGRVIGFAETERDGVYTQADVNKEGKILMTITGPPPQGESDTLAVARILVTALNARGDDWGMPREVHDGYCDCKAEDVTNPSNQLCIQVVRAIGGDKNVWKSLGKRTTSTTEWTAEEVVRAAEVRLLSKAKRLSRNDRAKVVIALDANRLPAFLMQEAKDSVLGQLASVCKALGFAAVWIIGPRPELSSCLYENTQT
jgi:hypothetical protein